MNFYMPVQRAKQHSGTAGEASPIEPMHVELMHRCNQAEEPKNPNTRKTNSPVEPTQHITSVGLTGDRKKSARAQKRFFQPATFGNLDDWGIKSSPKELKFWGDEDDNFKNTSPKDFNKSPHRLRGIGRNRSKSGVFSRTQKLRFERARESWAF